MITETIVSSCRSSDQKGLGFVQSRKGLNIVKSQARTLGNENRRKSNIGTNHVPKRFGKGKGGGHVLFPSGAIDTHHRGSVSKGEEEVKQELQITRSVKVAWP